MFRCITNVRGLVFDIDCFEGEDVNALVDLFDEYELLFMTSSEEMAQSIVDSLGEDFVYKTEGFQRFFAPNKHTHTEVLDKLGIQATELVYVSRKIGFLRNAMSFIGGTAWITDEISYEEASTAPDLICRSIDVLSKCLEEGVEGFFGEVVVYPDPSRHAGMIIPAEFESDQGIVPMYMLGRYFGYTHYMSQLHPYSSAIYLNKKEGSKSYGTYTAIFRDLISAAVSRVIDNYKIDGICAVPPRPGKANRFTGILDTVSREYGLENYGPLLICEKDYPSQKSLSYQERQENIRGVFSFGCRLHGESIIIVDDIITTGATMNECINTLYDAGAGEIYIVVLAVNQQGTNYWSSNEIQVSCPHCGSKMHLLINSGSKGFFYSCYECRRSTMNFSDGREEVEEYVNQEYS
ncbi:MAG: hypothetical protein KBG42_03915 [Lachnospiraceae bacterium]|nr:hypothetical protein [Lachnospiraceae bacterium]